MIFDDVAKAMLAVGAGTVIGWGANSLTLSGRVDAIERTLQRIEVAIYKLPDAPAPPVKVTP